MFSNINIKRVVIWLAIIMVVSLFLGTISLFAAGDFPFSSKGTTTEEINDEKTFSMDNIKYINVNTVSTDIKIIPVESKDIKVNFYGTLTSNGSGPSLETDITNNTLNIKIKYNKNSYSIFNFNFSKLNLDVYVPVSFSDNLNLSTVSGNIFLDRMSLNKLSTDSVSGNLDISEVIAASITFSTTSGNAELDNVNGNVSFKSVSGDLRAEFTQFANNINIDTVSGNSRIKLPDNTEFNFRFNTTSGKFDSDFPMTLTNNSKWNTSGNVGNSENEISAKSVSGDLKINK